MTYEFHPEAEQEFIEAAAFYEQNVTGLGERFGKEVRRAIVRLMEYPQIGSQIDADLRRLLLTRFPYFLIYSSTSDLLRVVAVAHVHRRPGYWRIRINH
ncbi:type II toxin-antitoxin system RelE/ParE family toxin [Nitrospira sp. T9]|uniref:type II toxin-antitoxin system RelE/ParE family toxin n=1 Tax=unclassified Nitrospira TaxID=2652172 RepID=UPI003F9C32A5